MSQTKVQLIEGLGSSLSVDTSGNVGIGSSTPSDFDDGGTGGKNLVIESDGVGRGVLTFAAEQTGGADEPLGIVNFVDSDSTNTSKRGSRILGLRGSDANSAYMRFETANSGAPAEVGRFTHDGEFRFNSGYGSVATAFGVRAWINFDGTLGTIGTGRASGNMDAVTDNGSGDYTLNFTNDMPGADFAVAGNCIEVGSTGSTDNFIGVKRATNYSDSMGAGFVRIATNGGANRDCFVMIVR
jgi:hypothetical protein